MSSCSQSPINLSQTTAKPCDLLCDLVMDDSMIPEANVIISNEGLLLQSTTSLGSCKFNGEGYTCNVIVVSHPSFHTIENIQADAEVIAIFTNPSGAQLCVSSLVRANSATTPSSTFLNAFIGYANPAVASTVVSLGNEWGLFQMVPMTGAYYVYDGTFVLDPCTPTKWVVFKAMININPTDFALLVKNSQPNSVSVQPLGDREVFFNDVSQLPGGPMPQDNKTYMKCRRVPKKNKDIKPVEAVDLQAPAKKNKKGTLAHWIENFMLIDVLPVLGIILGLGVGYWVIGKFGDGAIQPFKGEEWAAGKIRPWATIVWNWTMGVLTWLWETAKWLFWFLWDAITFFPRLIWSFWSAVFTAIYGFWAGLFKVVTGLFGELNPEKIVTALKEAAAAKAKQKMANAATPAPAPAPVPPKA